MEETNAERETVGGAEGLEEIRRHAHATAEVCREAIVVLLNDRQTFRHFADGVNASPAARQTWFPTIVARWYSQSMLVALRRLIDRDKRTDSLLVLFSRMILHPEAWSRDAMLSMWAADDRHGYEPDTLRFLLESTYRPFADESGAALDIERVRRDRESISVQVARIKTLVDKSIAHAERNWEPITVTFAELDNAVDVIHEVMKPYVALITGASYSDMTPTDQYRWWRIFDGWADLDPIPE